MARPEPRRPDVRGLRGVAPRPPGAGPRPGGERPESPPPPGRTPSAPRVDAARGRPRRRRRGALATARRALGLPLLGQPAGAPPEGPRDARRGGARHRRPARSIRTASRRRSRHAPSPPRIRRRAPVPRIAPRHSPPEAQRVPRRSRHLGRSCRTPLRDGARRPAGPRRVEPVDGPVPRRLARLSLRRPSRSSPPALPPPVAREALVAPRPRRPLHRRRLAGAREDP